MTGRAVRRTGESVDVDGHTPSVVVREPADTAQEDLLRARVADRPRDRGGERHRDLPRWQQVVAHRPDQRLCRRRHGGAWARQLRELRLHHHRDPIDPRHHQTAGGQHRNGRCRQPNRFRHRSSGSAGRPVHPRRILLAPRPYASEPQIAAGVHPPHLSDPVRRGRVPQHHRLGESLHQPARGDQGHRGCGHARCARGDAHRPRDDQAVDRLDLRVGAHPCRLHNLRGADPPRPIHQRRVRRDSRARSRSRIHSPST